MTISAQPTIAELAEIVSSRTKTIKEFLNKQELPEPAFGLEGPTHDYLPVDNVEILAARKELEDAAALLSALVAGPKRSFQRDCFFWQHNESTLHAIYKFNIPAHVPLPGSISYEELSEKCGLDLDKLRRFLRYAMTMHYFLEPEPGYVAHSAMSRVLATEPEAMDFLGHCQDEAFRAAAHQVDAMTEWNGSSKGTETGFTKAYELNEKGMTFFDLLSAEEWRSKRFAGGMDSISKEGSLYHPNMIANSFDFSQIPEGGTIVDVGGSVGHASVGMGLGGAKHCKFIVQDLPDVVGPVKDKPVPEGMEGRLEFQAHNFFEPQPVKDADAYFFRFIFHDWPDSECKKLIKNMLPALKPGARVLVNDNVLPDATYTPYKLEDRMQLAFDLQMLTLFNSRERTLGEWERLFSDSSDGKLKLESSDGPLVVFKFDG